jgi:hypothetical protein
MKKLSCFLVLLFSLPLWAVTPTFWETRTYDDFRKGKLTNLSLTNDDRLILAPRFDLTFNTEQPLIWSAVADSKGNVYLGTGHDGRIYKVDSTGKGELVADLSELDVFALAVDSKDNLYAGTSPDGKVYKIAPGGKAEPFFSPDAKYIWALAFDKQARLLVGTGDKGIIYRVTPDGKGETFYDTDETHVMSLAVDRDGNVLAGGDPKGYIYRISPEGKAFVLYDSGMREVHAISLGSNGNIYAAVLGGGKTGLPPGATPEPIRSPAEGGAPAVTVTLAATVGQSIEILPDPIGASDTPRGTYTGGSESSSKSIVLEILPDGTVNTLWRSKDEMVYSLLPHGSKLLFSTGTKGLIYSLEGERNTTLLVESTEEQTTRLIEAGGRVYAAAANAGKLFTLSEALATSGTFESTIRDTEAISSLGKIAWKAEQPSLIQVYTRTGNTSAPDKTWSDWTLVDAAGVGASPRARFIQWKAALRADAGRSPALTSVTVPYLQQNFRPEVTAIDVLPAGVTLNKGLTLNGTPAVNDPATARTNTRLGQPNPRIPPRRGTQKGAQSFQWTATDKNQDWLRYDLYYRGDTERTWKVLKKDLDDNFFTVSSDTLPDGTYVLKVVASDLPSNPAATALSGEMESRPFVIDNTPPAVTMKVDGIEGNRGRIAIDTADSTSTLYQAEISVDTGEWRTIFPKDGILDSKSESFLYVSDPLPSGEHVIAFRVYDQNDNVGIGKVVVRIP